MTSRTHQSINAYLQPLAAAVGRPVEEVEEVYRLLAGEARAPGDATDPAPRHRQEAKGGYASGAIPPLQAHRHLPPRPPTAGGGGGDGQSAAEAKGPDSAASQRRRGGSPWLAEMEWFYRDLGIDAHYFGATPRALIANQLKSLYAAKLLAEASDEPLELRLRSEGDDGAVYACRDDHAVKVAVEQRIESKYPDFQLQCYRSARALSPDDPESYLRLYFLMRPEYREAAVDEKEVAVDRVGARAFLGRTHGFTQMRYQDLLSRSIGVSGTVIDTIDRADIGARQLMICHRRGSTHSFFSAVTNVLHSYGLTSRRKYAEPFSNGMVIYNIYVDGLVPEEIISQVREDLSLIYVLPRTALTPAFQKGELSAQEVVYSYAARSFAHHFLSRFSKEYHLLAPAFAQDPVRLGILAQFKRRLSKDVFTEDRIHDVVCRYLPLIKELYADFARHHFARGPDSTQGYDPQHNGDLEERIRRQAASAIDQQVLSTFLLFNRRILKTNFYRDSKVALAFRIDPVFLKDLDYGEVPFGMFFVVGSEFRGFHVRFRDIARGGIRIIRSGTTQAYLKNLDSLFDEAYQLALTQQSKNKDIAEGGAKGTILLARDHQDKGQLAFRKYVDSLLDLLVPNEEVADHYGHPELLFLGPDEGTAELMDWASRKARQRGYTHWKSFTTGKSPESGGIPHDRYGMTTRSVHQYVAGILRKLRLDERSVSKLQTGGPDGDLGSNEIKISKDRTIAVVDGSGVLYDPGGIARDELRRLADARMPVREFDRAKIGVGGFLTTIEERDVRLPDGTDVASGMMLRDEFHLMPISTAELFVPCGGRPDSVTINNVQRLLDERGHPRFRYIVEGANLFFTQPARLALEEAGAIVFKDASANKGGVTSSSLEVLAALALTDKEFSRHMEVRDEVPAFYRTYVDEVQRNIETNAALEFERIWEEHERTGRPRTMLSDEIGAKINRLKDHIQSSSLWDDIALRDRILGDACPLTLRKLLGLATIVERVPHSYLRAFFAAHLASRYVYQYGLEATEVEFFDFIRGG